MQHAECAKPEQQLVTISRTSRVSLVHSDALQMLDYSSHYEGCDPKMCWLWLVGVVVQQYSKGTRLAKAVLVYAGP